MFHPSVGHYTRHEKRHQMMYNMIHFYTKLDIAMRTTLNIDDHLLAEAQRVTGVKEKASLVREGLRALIERESARRLARLGGSEANLEAAPRRRSHPT